MAIIDRQIDMGGVKTEYVISIGSDSGDRVNAVKESIHWLSLLLDDFAASDVYETLPVGHAGSNYMNAVAVGKTSVSYSELEQMCKAHEVDRGRDERARKEKRVPVDIDIVIAGGEVVRPKDFRRGFFQIGYRQLRSEN